MIEVAIPGHAKLRLNHAVLDFNGTIACDGILLEGVRERLNALADSLWIHVVTADTFGGAQDALEGVRCAVRVLPKGGQDVAKLDYVAQLDRKTVVAIGNGRNDKLMLQAAALGIAVIGPECAAAETVAVADLLAPDIHAALDLLLNPMRLVATLRT